MNDEPIPGWRQVGGVDPAQLAAARLELHHAVQLASVAGRGFLPARPDDSHSSLVWLSRSDRIAGEPIGGDSPFRLAIDPARVTMMFLDSSETVTATFPLPGRTLLEALAWIRTQLAARGADPARYSLAKPYELAPHPLLDGAAFRGEPIARFQELTLYWANAHGLLGKIREEAPGASEIRLWPHHFDVGLIITLDARTGESTRTIGVGLSPGDEGSAEPYFYVTPSPPPLGMTLPALGTAGSWHTEHWVGALLAASKIASQPTAERQQKIAGDFLHGAISMCRDLLD